MQFLDYKSHDVITFFAGYVILFLLFFNKVYIVCFSPDLNKIHNIPESPTLKEKVCDIY